MGFSRQEGWSGLPFSLPGDFPNPGIEPESPAHRPHLLHCRQIPYHWTTRAVWTEVCSTYFLVSLGWLRKAGLYLSETLGHAHLLCGQLANLPLSNVPGARQTSRPIYLKLRLEVTEIWTFLVAQWLRILLPVQGPRVPFPLRKGSTCQGAMKPMGNNYWTCTLEPMLCNKKSHCSPQLEKARAQQWSLGTAKNKHTHTQKKSELLHSLTWP